MLIPSGIVSYFKTVPCKILEEAALHAYRKVCFLKACYWRSFSSTCFFFFRTQLDRTASKFNSNRGRD